MTKRDIWYAANRERILAKAKERYREKKEEILQKQKQYYEENRDFIRQKHVIRYRTDEAYADDRRQRSLEWQAKRRRLKKEGGGR